MYHLPWRAEERITDRKAGKENVHEVSCMEVSFTTEGYEQECDQNGRVGIINRTERLKELSMMLSKG